MKLRLRIIDVLKLLLCLYIALKVLFQGYSNAYEIMLSLTMLIVNMCIAVKRKMQIEEGKIWLGGCFLIFWILLSIISGRSTGNLGPVFMQIEFLLCFINYVFILHYLDCNDKKFFCRYTFVITALSLAYNIRSYVIHPEYRINLYLNSQAKGAFIGGVSFSMYIAFFTIIQLHDLVFEHSKIKVTVIAIKMITVIACIYYLVMCSPSATVLLVSLLSLLFLFVAEWGKRSGRKSISIIGMILLAVFLPFLLRSILSFVLEHIDSSSRLYDRFNAILQVIRTPSEIFTNNYFTRVIMLIDEIKLTFSSSTTMIFGKGYNFGTYSSVSQQMESLGIGYHSSMIDWFPTYGLISGIVLWETLHQAGKYFRSMMPSLTITCIWFTFIIYNFFNAGFYSILITAVIFYSISHYQVLNANA